MENDLTEVKGMIEVSARDFKILPDSEIRSILRLKKYQKISYSALDVINRVLHFDNSREVEYFKNLKDEEFQSKYVKYLLSIMYENLN